METRACVTGTFTVCEVVGTPGGDVTLMTPCSVCAQCVVTHSAPADQVVGVRVLHQRPQFGEKSWNVAGVAAVYSHGPWRLLHADTCPLPRCLQGETKQVCVRACVCVCVCQIPDYSMINSTSDDVLLIIPSLSLSLGFHLSLCLSSMTQSPLCL